MRRHFWRAFFKPYAIETNASSMKPISTLHIIIVTRNGKILPKSLPSRPKHRGLLFLKKNMVFSERNQLFAGDFRANLDEKNADLIQFTKRWNWKWIF